MNLSKCFPRLVSKLQGQQEANTPGAVITQLPPHSAVKYLFTLFVSQLFLWVSRRHYQFISLFPEDCKRRLIPLSCLCSKYEATTSSWLAQLSTNTGNMRKQLIYAPFYVQKQVYPFHTITVTANILLCTLCFGMDVNQYIHLLMNASVQQMMWGFWLTDVPTSNECGLNSFVLSFRDQAVVWQERTFHWLM